jgi:hypothetical protein
LGKAGGASTRINPDLSQMAVAASESLPRAASPLPGVGRRMLEPDGDEVARIASLNPSCPAGASSSEARGGRRIGSVRTAIGRHAVRIVFSNDVDRAYGEAWQRGEAFRHLPRTTARSIKGLPPANGTRMLNTEKLLLADLPAARSLRRRSGQEQWA